MPRAVKSESGIEYKVCILGHTQRGGSPSVRDRCTASLMGATAVQALLDGQSAKMVALNNNQIDLRPFPPPEDNVRQFCDKHLLGINNILCDIRNQ